MKEPKMKLSDAEAEAFTRYLTTTKKGKKKPIDELVDILLKLKEGQAFLKNWRRARY